MYNFSTVISLKLEFNRRNALKGLALIREGAENRMCDVPVEEGMALKVWLAGVGYGNFIETGLIGGTRLAWRSQTLWKVTYLSSAITIV